MANQVLHGALGIVKKDGVTIGHMKSISVNENHALGRVMGIGEYEPVELPALQFSGSMQCDFYGVDFKTDGVPDAIKRSANSAQDVVDNILLNDEGVEVVLFKKVEDTIDPETGLVVATSAVYARVSGAFLETSSFNVSEGQISGMNQSFQIKKMIKYTP